MLVTDGAGFIGSHVAEQLIAMGHDVRILDDLSGGVLGNIPPGALFNYTNNVIGSVNLLNAAVRTGVELFVFTSSIAAYGDSAALPLTEDAPLHPQDSYGIAKYAAEMELATCRTMFGLVI